MNAKAHVAAGYTTREAADVLECSYQWLANLRWQGKGPRWLKVRGRVYYPKEALHRYKKAMKTEGP